ncbi:Flavin reductase [Paraconexibacter sp. AEG42_29]|uniref:Flavin reductase n=1 Tax=Paraconexibacter sp. AEG42_29 TaxID=2997339 RepID=A0AAU7B3F8_9ACTN
MSSVHDAARFRQILGHYPTGVCVVCGIDPAGEPAGLVVGSFTSVSLDPPLVAFFPDHASTTWPRIVPGRRFCVNVLGHDQQDLCRRFAVSGGDKFADVEWRPAAATGSPALRDATAWVDCELEAVHRAGDHDIVVGRVLDLGLREEPAEPLLFLRGGYGRFMPL